MADVHECDDHHLSRKVMLKRVRKRSEFGRLLDEKKALLLLRSPHVLQLLDFVRYNYGGVDENGLILEKIEGVDLEEGSLVADRSYVFDLWQIASGLTDIHAQDIIHRDIKPQNLRRQPNGTITILDFGLARERGKDDKTNTITGTMGYMAPELRGDRTIHFTQAVDVFAFGVTALTLLQGDPAAFFRGATGAALEGLISAAHPSFDPSLIKLIVSCLSHNPDQRPKMSNVRDHLARWITKDKHRAWLIKDGTKHELSATSRSVSLNTAVGNVTIRYNGYHFVASAVSGEVFVNNRPTISGQTLPPACVITFGDSTRPSRAFCTFDVSRPEVAL